MSPFFFHNTLKYTYTLAHKQAAHGTTENVRKYSVKHTDKQPWLCTRLNSSGGSETVGCLSAVSVVTQVYHVHDRRRLKWTPSVWHRCEYSDMSLNHPEDTISTEWTGSSVCVGVVCVCVWSWMPCEPAAGLWVKWTKIPAVAISQCKHESFA